MSGKNAIIDMTFISGYTARQMFTLIEAMLGETPIICYSDHFEIKHAVITDNTTESKIVVYFKPRMDNILKYDTTPELFNSGDIHVLNPASKQFMSYVSSTTKKDFLQISCPADDPDSVYANIIKTDNTGSGNSRFRNTRFRPQIIEDSCTQVKPNIKIPLSSVCDTGVLIHKNKTSYDKVLYIGYKEGFEIKGDGHDGTDVIGKRWGKCDEEDYIATYPISIEKNRCISGINKIPDNGVIALFFSESTIKLKFPVGSYGDMTIMFNKGHEAPTKNIFEEEEEEVPEKIARAKLSWDIDDMYV